MRTSTPSRDARYGVSTRSQPPTSAPHARASCAYADRPAPPIPTNQSLLPASGCKPDQLLRDLVRRVRPGGTAHCLSHALEPRRILEQLPDEPGHCLERRVAHDDGAARMREVLRVLRLVVARRARVRDED